MPADHLPLLFLTNEPDTAHYSSPPKLGGPKAPHRDDPSAHGAWLKRQMETAWTTARQTGQQAISVSTQQGVYLEVAGQAGHELLTDKLEMRRDGIKLLNVHREPLPGHPETIITKVTIFIPEGKQQVLLKKIEDYSNAGLLTPKGHRHHQDVMNSIEHIRLAVLESFWSDDPGLMPTDGQPAWCEFWLAGDQASGVEGLFRELAFQQEIRCSDAALFFPERTVLLGLATKPQLLRLLSEPLIAEIRRAQETAHFWTSSPNEEQTGWAKNLLGRLRANPDPRVSVCILDTGVNNGHMLLSPILATGDCHSVNPNWGTHDHHGHGTAMAGIAGYGNLASALESRHAVTVRHGLESVKILPPPPHHNKPELYGAITAEAIARVESVAPERLRSICMAVSTDARDRGRPSSWSAELDALAAGTDNPDEIKRLIVLAAGNTASDEWNAYPDSNLTASVQNPGQSWNALTVGAFTSKAIITDPTFSGYTPLAMAGDMSPFNTTSLTWEERKWPVKPDIVLEGGNVAKDILGFCTVCDDLSSLTTGHDPARRVFDSFNMTSHAAAQAAWMAAQIQDSYPQAWPETVRGLLVHSASWTEAMRQRWPIANKSERANLLRCCGYGVPNLKDAMECARSHFTIITQQVMQPYENHPGSVRAKDMHLFKLPWPKDELLQLDAIDAKLKITLSYFIEPSPGEVGWKSRYRYPSHTLRFALQSVNETEEQFKYRINVAARDGSERKPETKSEPNRWMLGEQARDFGSIHSDTWEGSAAELATCNLVAVYPIGGWWKERHHLGKSESRTRYSLIISVLTNQADVDIYTPVATKINVPIAVKVQ
jgi:hypothetical protein